MKPAPSSECACQSSDARMCYIVRYDIDPSDDQFEDERCECSCHSDEWDDYEENGPQDLEDVLDEALDRHFGK